MTCHWGTWAAVSEESCWVEGNFDNCLGLAASSGAVPTRPWNFLIRMDSKFQMQETLQKQSSSLGDELNKEEEKGKVKTLYRSFSRD